MVRINAGNLTRAERYILKINAGRGSRKFKEFLLSRPMDAYVVQSRGRGITNSPMS